MGVALSMREFFIDSRIVNALGAYMNSLTPTLNPSPQGGGRWFCLKRYIIVRFVMSFVQSIIF